MRINTEKELITLVKKITKVITTEEDVKSFLDARYVAYDKEAGVDANIKMKDGKHYLPYPYNIKLVAKLYDVTTSTNEEDAWDI